jgi:hypothetical protein
MSYRHRSQVNSIGFSPLPPALVGRGPPDPKLKSECYIVRDANAHAIAYVYFEDEPEDEARRNVAKLPELLRS